MEALAERLRRGQVLLADGATGTMLMERGLRLGECPEALNLERPEVVAEVASLYLEAGADLLSTNTFGGSALKLASYGLEERTEEINRRAVEIARTAAAGRALVLASCGPCGKLLKPYGDTDAEVVAASFRRQAAALVAAGADVICVETMIDLAEARLAVAAAKEAGPEVPVLATMTFDRTPRGFFTAMGVTVQQAAEGLAEAGADAVGSNCGNGLDTMVELAAEFARHSTQPLVIQSNAGLPSNRAGEVVYPEGPQFFAERVPALVAAGVVIIGGCCGTTPEHIRAMRQVLAAS